MNTKILISSTHIYFIHTEADGSSIRLARLSIELFQSNPQAEPEPIDLKALGDILVFYADEFAVQPFRFRREPAWYVIFQVPDRALPDLYACKIGLDDVEEEDGKTSQVKKLLPVRTFHPKRAQFSNIVPASHAPAQVWCLAAQLGVSVQAAQSSTDHFVAIRSRLSVQLAENSDFNPPLSFYDNSLFYKLFQQRFDPPSWDQGLFLKVAEIAKCLALKDYLESISDRPNVCEVTTGFDAGFLTSWRERFLAVMASLSERSGCKAMSMTLQQLGIIIDYLTPFWTPLIQDCAKEFDQETYQKLLELIMFSHVHGNDTIALELYAAARDFREALYVTALGGLSRIEYTTTAGAVVTVLKMIPSWQVLLLVHATAFASTGQPCTVELPQIPSSFDCTLESAFNPISQRIQLADQAYAEKLHQDLCALVAIVNQEYAVHNGVVDPVSRWSEEELARFCDMVTYWRAHPRGEIHPREESELAEVSLPGLSLGDQAYVQEVIQNYLLMFHPGRDPAQVAAFDLLLIASLEDAERRLKNMLFLKTDGFTRVAQIANTCNTEAWDQLTTLNLAQIPVPLGRIVGLLFLLNSVQEASTVGLIAPDLGTLRRCFFSKLSFAGLSFVLSSEIFGEACLSWSLTTEQGEAGLHEILRSLPEHLVSVFLSHAVIQDRIKRLFLARVDLESQARWLSYGSTQIKIPYAALVRLPSDSSRLMVTRYNLLFDVWFLVQLLLETSEAQRANVLGVLDPLLWPRQQNLEHRAMALSVTLSCLLSEDQSSPILLEALEQCFNHPSRNFLEILDSLFCDQYSFPFPVMSSKNPRDFCLNFCISSPAVKAQMQDFRVFWKFMARVLSHRSPDTAKYLQMLCEVFSEVRLFAVSEFELRDFATMADHFVELPMTAQVILLRNLPIFKSIPFCFIKLTELLFKSLPRNFEAQAQLLSHADGDIFHRTLRLMDQAYDTDYPMVCFWWSNQSLEQIRDFMQALQTQGRDRFISFIQSKAFQSIIDPRHVECDLLQQQKKVLIFALLIKFSAQEKIELPTNYTRCFLGVFRSAQVGDLDLLRAPIQALQACPQVLPALFSIDCVQDFMMSRIRSLEDFCKALSWTLLYTPECNKLRLLKGLGDRVRDFFTRAVDLEGLFAVIHLGQDHLSKSEKGLLAVIVDRAQETIDWARRLFQFYTQCLGQLDLNFMPIVASKKARDELGEFLFGLDTAVLSKGSGISFLIHLAENMPMAGFAKKSDAALVCQQIMRFTQQLLKLEPDLDHFNLAQALQSGTLSSLVVSYAFFKYVFAAYVSIHDHLAEAAENRTLVQQRLSDRINQVRFIIQIQPCFQKCLLVLNHPVHLIDLKQFDRVWMAWVQSIESDNMTVVALRLFQCFASLPSAQLNHLLSIQEVTKKIFDSLPLFDSPAATRRTCELLKSIKRQAPECAHLLAHHPFSSWLLGVMCLINPSSPDFQDFMQSLLDLMPVSLLKLYMKEESWKTFGAQFIARTPAEVDQIWCQLFGHLGSEQRALLMGNIRAQQGLLKVLLSDDERHGPSIQLVRIISVCRTQTEVESLLSRNFLRNIFYVSTPNQDVLRLLIHWIDQVEVDCTPDTALGLRQFIQDLQAHQEQYHRVKLDCDAFDSQSGARGYTMFDSYFGPLSLIATTQDLQILADHQVILSMLKRDFSSLVILKQQLRCWSISSKVIDLLEAFDQLKKISYLHPRSSLPFHDQAIGYDLGAGDSADAKDRVLVLLERC